MPRLLVVDDESKIREVIHEPYFPEYNKRRADAFHARIRELLFLPD